MSDIELTRPKFRQVSIFDLKESGLNDLIYRPASLEDPGIRTLAQSISKIGLQEPIKISLDNYIISGHRRRLACEFAGKTSVLCQVVPIKSTDPEFIMMLRENNRQRVKGRDELIQEGVVDATQSIQDTEFNLIVKKVKRSRVTVDAMEIVGEKRRAAIKGNRSLLDAAIEIIERLHDFWPISDRTIHYKLLNNPPLMHRAKPGSIYKNDKDNYCYKTLTNVLTRGRLIGEIPWEAITDDTRPLVVWNVYRDISLFIKQQNDKYMKDYFRDYMQSQPNHVEIAGEKLTIESIIRPVAMKYCIPYTIGRGYSSINPRHDMAERLKNSGKEKLVVLLISDFDPDGDEIAQSFARSMRDDFGVDIYPIHVALKKEQVDERGLPSGGKAKKGSKNYKKFVAAYGDDVFELEALDPKDLQEILDKTIRGVIDISSFNHEKIQENLDQQELQKYRQKAINHLQEGGMQERE